MYVIVRRQTLLSAMTNRKLWITIIVKSWRNTTKKMVDMAFIDVFYILGWLYVHRRMFSFNHHLKTALVPATDPHRLKKMWIQSQKFCFLRQVNQALWLIFLYFSESWYCYLLKNTSIIYIHCYQIKGNLLSCFGAVLT